MKIDRPNHWAESAKYWRTVPRLSFGLLLFGIFCLFTSMGLVVSMINVMKTRVSGALVLAFVTGIFAVGWALAGFLRIIPLMVALFPVQFVSMSFLSGYVTQGVRVLTASSADHSLMHERLVIEGTLAMALIVSGYVWVVAFVRKEGLRIFGTLTEVKLANEVHHALVPVLSRRLGEFDVYGISIANGAMGGDLVDAIEDNGRWTAYVADVSGHGVSAGMIMAMVKSATRMGSADQSSMSHLLANMNQVLASMSAPNIFVTFAGISGTHGPALDFSLAGHLPILHYRKHLNVIEERSVSNLPLAVLPGTSYDSSTIQCERGDLLAIITDGLTEVSDSQEEEIGMGPLKATLLASAGLPLDQIAQAMRERALRQGKQTDDQTVLLLRRVQELA